MPFSPAKIPPLFTLDSPICDEPNSSRFDLDGSIEGHQVVKYAIDISDGEKMEEIAERESIFHKKLKIKLKQQGEEGRIELLKEYLDYLIRNKKTIPPDFPTFVREIIGLDERGGFIHIKIWHEKSELVEFAKSKNYEYKIDHYD